MHTSRLIVGWIILAASLRAQGVMEPAQLREDFAILRKTLEAAHSGLYRYASKPAMDAHFDDAAKKLNRAMTPVEFRLVIAPALSAIKCGHTQLRDDPALIARLGSQAVFPFRVWAEEKRFYVLENQSLDGSVKPGAEVLAVNGRAMKDLMREMLPLLHGDGDIQTGKLKRLARGFPALYAMTHAPVDYFEVKVRDGAGTRTVKVAAVKMADLAKNGEANAVNAAMRESARKLEGVSDNIILRFVDGDRAAVLRVRRFSGNDFRDIIERHFSALREKKTQKLIVDLRGNGGGSDHSGALFVSYLGGEPFRYFERIRMRTIDPPREHTNYSDRDREGLKTGTEREPGGGYRVLASMHPGVDLQAPGKTPFVGKVFILIDGGCFSTCADVSAVAHHLRRATFIGEETGGGYYGNNSGASLTVTLPNSKIPVAVPMWAYENAVSRSKEKRRGTMPDRAVTTRAADLIAGRDAVLETALDMAK